MNNALFLGLASLLCLIIIGVTALRFWLSSLTLKHGRSDPARIAHLTSHLVAKGGLSGAIDFTFPEDFYSKKLILLGEIHGYGAMAWIDYEMIVHLNQRAGIRDYLAELSPIEAALFNAYLKSGDDAITAPIFDSFKGQSRWANTDFPEKLKKLRAYNDTLPDAAKVRFVGIDVVQNYGILDHWLGLTTRPEAANEQAPAAAYVNLIEAADPAKLVGGAVTKAEILHGLRLTASGLEREAVILENYQYQVKQGGLGDRPAYGLWGLVHVLRTSINRGFLPFAARVATSDLPAAKSMACIPAWSDGGSVMIANNEFKGLFRSKTRAGTPIRFLENDGPIYFLEGLGDLRAATQAAGLGKTGVTVFKLDGADTPFQTPSGFGQQHTTFRSGLTYDALDTPIVEVFDYAMLVRGSPAARPVAS